MSMSHCCFAFFRAHLDIDDNTSGQIVSGLDVTCGLVNLPSTHEEPWSGRLVQGSGSRGPAPTLRERILFPSMFHQSSILPLFQTVQIGLCLPHNVNVL